MTTQQPNYDKLLNPIAEINTSVEALLDGAFGPTMGDQREGLKRVHSNAWGLHTLLMDVVTNLGIENIARRDYLERKFGEHVQPIVENAQTLLDGVDGPLNPEQVVAVEFICDTGHLLKRHVETLCFYSQLVHNKVKRPMVPIAIQDIVEPLELPVTTKPIELELLLSENLPIARGDAHLLKRSIEALVSNAINFTDEGTIKVTGTADQKFVSVQVQDSGIGIKRDDQRRIFEPFYQVNPQRHHGIGLGLTLAQKMVALQGGKIAVKSSVNQGTTFTLTIPLA